VPPFVHSHVQLNWQNDFIIPRRTRFLRKLAQRHRVITFDNRGQGLSWRGLPPSLRLADFDLDTEAVAGQIADETFVLAACARASHLAVRYIEKHPGRVSALVLISAHSTQNSIQELMPLGSAPPSGLFDLLASQNWEFFLQTQVLPGSSPEEIRTATEMLKQCSSPEDYRLTWDTWRQSDVSDLLPTLRLPTLVLHARDFPFLRPEEAARLASMIPHARLALIDGYDIFGDADQCIGAIETFLDDIPSPQTTSAHLPHELSQRELEVLRHIVSGKSNQQIADELVISPNTVRRHVSNIFDKIGAANRTQAAAYARDHGLA
jgi:DNA-binding CsgD family transcriptional regulator/pimeloyl-ACP methyl ester carboxylesterase